MRKAKRALAVVLSLVVALGAVSYRPPKAHAIITETALVNAAMFSYMSSTGFTFMGKETLYGSMVEDLQKATNNFMREFADFREYVYDDLMNTISSGITVIDNSVLKLNAWTANLFAEFEDWLIDKLGLVSSDGVLPDNSAVFVPGIKEGLLNCGGVIVPAFPEYDESVYPYMHLVYNRNTKSYYFIATSNRGEARNGGAQILATLLMREYQLTSSGTWKFSRSGESGVWVHDNSLTDFIWANYNICFSDGLVCYSGSAVEAVPDEDNPIISVSLPVGYEAAPTVDEQYSMVIGTALSCEDEQSLIDAILSGTAAGTLTPTYTIEKSTAGDVAIPDEDEERTGILNWVKKIEQSVRDIPQAISQAVATTFVPSEDYIAAVPDMIATTFDNRTGFLTYPTSVLYDFCDMVGDPAGDFILAWPNVYEPYSAEKLISAGQFNVSKFVRDDIWLSSIYDMYQLVPSTYMVFWFLGLCRRKYNSVVGDRLEG